VGVAALLVGLGELVLGLVEGGVGPVRVALTFFSWVETSVDSWAPACGSSIAATAAAAATTASHRSTHARRLGAIF
jgi:hypothetical protein